MRNQKEWQKLTKLDEEIFKKFPDLPHYLVQLMFNRGMDQKDVIDNFLNPDYADLLDPFLILDMRKVVDRIVNAIRNREKIMIVSDYDADGICGAMILYKALSNIITTDVFAESLGEEVQREKYIQELVVHIPDRAEEGYSLTSESVRHILREEAKLILVVDCGLSNKNQVDFLTSSGVDVVILDHHALPEELPDTYAMLVPKRVEDRYEFKELSGSGLAFKLVSALYIQVRFMGFAKALPEGTEKWFLDFACIGTVADRVPLVGENRIIVKYGLHVLSQTKNIGLNELLSELAIAKEPMEFIEEDQFLDKVSVESIIQKIAPAINAAGFENGISRAFDLFCEENSGVALDKAKDIVSLAIERNDIIKRVIEEVDERIQKRIKTIESEKFFMEGSESWPSFILGEVASAIVKRYNKPTILYNKRRNINVASMRSIEGFDISKVIFYNKDFIEVGGGHKMAAGMTFTDDMTEKIYEKTLELMEGEISPTMYIPKVRVDAQVLPSDVNWTLYDVVNKMAPFGSGNEIPNFYMRDLHVNEIRTDDEDKSLLRIMIQSDEQIGVPVKFEAVAKDMEHIVHSIYDNDLIEIVFHVDVHEWLNKRNLQLKVVDVRKMLHLEDIGS
jgi:single-stranded-DNA-specific exonuclease